MAKNVTVIRAKSVFTPYREIQGGFIVIVDGKIEAIGSGTDYPTGDHVSVYDFTHGVAAPGFIDLHHHGAVGHRASEGEVDALKAIGEFLPSTGTTGWLPTVNNVPGCKAIKDFIDLEGQWANALGVHLEGPFLAPKNTPGDPFEEPIKADRDLFDELSDASGGTVRLIGIAPELEGALDLIRYVREKGVVPACAHTKVDYDFWLKAVDAGLQHVTHAYNVMTGLHHRRPGVVGGVLTSDGVTAELIGDGFHVHPVAMDILIRCKGIDNITLITDCAKYAGLPDGEYESSWGKLIKKGGIIRRAGFDESVDGTMAGSAWTMDHNIRCLVQDVGVPVKDVFRMASTVPARVIGLDDRKGSLQVGKDADLTILDGNLEIAATFIGGREVYKRDKD